VGLDVTYLHLKILATISQVLSNKHSALFTDQQGSRIYHISKGLQISEKGTLTSVAADVVRADREIGNLEVLHAVDVEALVEHTMLDDTVALLWSHRASLP
jgi:hypothetical protein